MNTVKGKIVDISVHGSLSLVRINVSGSLISSIVIDTPDSLEYLRIGQSIKAIFKETEVIIAPEDIGPISLQNRFVCEVLRIERGGLLSRIDMTSDLGQITSIITTRAVDEMGLKAGITVTAMIKTNEVMISE